MDMKEATSLCLRSGSLLFSSLLFISLHGPSDDLYPGMHRADLLTVSDGYLFTSVESVEVAEELNR